MHSIAGRHGSYMTQFTKGGAKAVFESRSAMRTAYSKKALDRRLVLPLDTHNWARAFEVLNAGYAKLGRTPEHYQSVLRDMVNNTPRTHFGDAAQAVDRVRDQAYAGEIPTNASLWVTLVWAYCTLEQPDAAYTCFLQARRRHNFSTATAHHMAELLLPALCRHGHLEDAKSIVSEFFSTSAATTSSSSDDATPRHHSTLDASAVQQLLAEASAQNGEWASAFTSLAAAASANTSGAGAPSDMRDKAKGVAPRTVNSLFFSDPTNEGKNRNDIHSSSSSSSPQPTSAAATSAQSPTRSARSTRGLSMPARRQLLRSLCESGRDEDALALWHELYGATHDGTQQHDLPSAADLCSMINVLAVAGRWEQALDLFCLFHLGRPWDAVRSRKAGTSAEVDGGFGTPSSRVALSVISLNLVFSVFPRTEVAAECVLGSPTNQQTQATSNCLRLVEVQHPEEVIQLLDVLLMECDDMIITDHVMDAVGAAMRQRGEHTRLLSLLRNTPLFANGRAAKKAASPSEKDLKERLVHLVYYLHSGTTKEVMYTTLLQFPFLFPPEVFRHLPPLHELPARLQELAKAKERGDHEECPAASGGVELTDDEIFEKAMGSRVASSVRPGRHTYFPPRASAVLAEKQDAQMKVNFSALHARRDDPFTGGDADKDPRPIPKGLHDKASGWNFYGRGGEMVFSNNRRIPNPLSMQPKVMRSLANPYRGWSPKQNSSLAHRESVIKWNGKSAV